MAVTQRSSILLVDDDEAVCDYLVSLLSSKYELVQVHNSLELDLALRDQVFDVVLLDLLLDEGIQGLPLLKFVKDRAPDSDIIIVSGVRMVQTVVSAIQVGASDFLQKPFTREELYLTLDRVLSKRQLRKQNEVLIEARASGLESETYQIVGSSQALRTVYANVKKLKGKDAHVFITGPTGSGKELLARELHRQENLPDRPFISVNCAAIPHHLIESVLFGHEKGAFTGATARKLGKFELANGGDIFLDEINSLDIEVQSKLLRVIEQQEVERLGSNQPLKLSFRVISASNVDIEKAIAERTFREDLYYRLNTVNLRLPSLNERPEDILEIAEFFLKKFSKGSPVKSLSLGAKALLKSHNWKGNVRELRNTIENVVIFCEAEVIEPKDIPLISSDAASTSQQQGALHSAVSAKPSTQLIDQPLNEQLHSFERNLILANLEKNRWSKTLASKDLGITRAKLYRRMRELGIET